MDKILKTKFSPIYLLLIGILIVSSYAGVMLNNKRHESVVSTYTPKIGVEVTETATPTEAVVSNIATTNDTPKSLDGGKYFNLVNGYRTSRGLPALKWKLNLCEYAKARSQQATTEFNHDQYRADEERRYTEICPECGAMGENLSQGYPNEEMALQGQIKSPTHNENMLRDWSWGCVMVNDRTMAIIFGRPK